MVAQEAVRDRAPLPLADSFSPLRFAARGGTTLDSRKRQLGGTMWWGIGLGGLLYFVLLVTLGVMTLRNGHGWMFFFGIFLPILWIVGAIMRPTPAGAT